MICNKKNVLTSLGKSVLISLGLMSAASATDPTIRKKVFWLGMTALINSNKEMDDIAKKVESLYESNLLIQLLLIQFCLWKKFKIKQENKKVDFLTCY